MVEHSTTAEEQVLVLCRTIIEINSARFGEERGTASRWCGGLLSRAFDLGRGARSSARMAEV
jgi:hypothetical protein